MTFKQLLYESVLYPLFDGVRQRENISRLRLLRSSQRWDSQQLAKWQLEHLKALLRHAERNVPFYRQRFRENGFSSDAMTSLTDIRRIPILTKQDIRDHNEELKAVNIPSSRFLPGRTGGSTGVPMHFYYDRDGRNWSRATTMRCAEWAGLYLGDRLSTMSGSHFDYNLSKLLLIRFRNWVLRTRPFTMTVVTDEVMCEYATAMKAWKPKVLWGYASALYLFADFILRTQYTGIELHSIVSTSETLLPEWRATIENAFGCRVFDHYGERAFYVAGECEEHSGFHVNAETLVVETVQGRVAAASGEIGKIIVTDLFNYAFPFIRYDTDDVGVRTDRHCKCGRTLPLLDKIEGRVWDIIATPDGRYITPPSISLPLSDVANVNAYQLVQDRLDKVRVCIVPGTHYSVEDTQYIRNALHSILGDTINLEVEFVQHIPIPESGKRRVVISHVTDGVLTRGT